MSFSRASGKLPVGTLDKAIADHVLTNRNANPNMALRRWNDALMHNLGCWKGRREFRGGAKPFESALKFATSSGGLYCEGLVLLTGSERPEAAIWVDLPERLVCFTHDLTSTSHGIQGFPMPDSAVNYLCYTRGIKGGYLYSKDMAVANMLIPWFVRNLIDGIKPSLQ